MRAPSRRAPDQERIYIAPAGVGRRPQPSRPVEPLHKQQGPTKANEPSENFLPERLARVSQPTDVMYYFPAIHNEGSS